MNTLRKSSAVFFALLFIGSAVMALFLFNFDRTAFTAETYQEAFAREELYNKLPAVMAQTLTSSGADQSQFPIVMQGLSATAWEGFFRALLPPESLKAMGDDMLNSTFAYLNQKTDSAQLNLVPLKTGMTSDTAVQAVFSLLGTLPDCTFAQVGQMTLDLLGGGQIQFCNPPAELSPLLAPVIQGQLQVMAALMPDQVTLIAAPAQDDPRQQLQFARVVMRLSPLLPLFFLLILTLLAVRSLKDWLGWWGVPLTIAGAIALGISIIGAPVFSAILQRILANRMPEFLPVLLLDYTTELASAMVRALLRPVLWQGLALGVLGLIMAGTGYFVRPANG